MSTPSICSHVLLKKGTLGPQGRVDRFAEAAKLCPPIEGDGFTWKLDEQKGDFEGK